MSLRVTLFFAETVNCLQTGPVILTHTAHVFQFPLYSPLRPTIILSNRRESSSMSKRTKSVRHIVMKNMKTTTFLSLLPIASGLVTPQKAASSWPFSASRWLMYNLTYDGDPVTGDALYFNFTSDQTAMEPSISVDCEVNRKQPYWQPCSMLIAKSADWNRGVSIIRDTISALSRENICRPRPDPPKFVLDTSSVIEWLTLDTAGLGDAAAHDRHDQPQYHALLHECIFRPSYFLQCGTLVLSPTNISLRCML